MGETNVKVKAPLGQSFLCGLEIFMKGQISIFLRLAQQIKTPSTTNNIDTRNLLPRGSTHIYSI